MKNSNVVTMFDIERDRPEEEHPLLEAWVQRAVAEELFQHAGLDFNAAKKRAQSADFKPIPLPSATVSVAYTAQHSRIISKNVVGILEGTAHPKETVLYTAHWDHLGIGPPDARGDRINEHHR